VCPWHGGHSIDFDTTLLTFSIGANGAPHENAFAQAIINCDVELVETLLRATAITKRVSNECVSRNLLPATNQANLPLVLLLLRAGADTNQDGALALKYAVEMGRVDIVTALVMGTKPPSGASLNRALNHIFTRPPTVINNSYDIIEVLLCGNPVGDARNEGLFKATFLDKLNMMHLLLAHRADINYDHAAAIRHAIQQGRGDLVGILLQDQVLRPELASELVSRIPEKAHSAEKVYILSKLLLNNASGTQCSQLLIIAADQNDLDVARLLVASRDQNGSTICSVDYNAARCLQKAVARSNVEMVKLLALEGAPSKFSLAKAFSSIPQNMSPANHFLVVQFLLRAGAEGPEVDAALHVAVTSMRKSNQLIELLVQYGAVISEKTLLSVVLQGSEVILKILLTGEVSAEACASAIASAITVHTHEVRYNIIELLLGPATAAGLESPWLTKAVIHILQNCPEDKILLHLLCVQGKANINLHDGLAVILATKNCDHEILDITLQSKGGLPSSATIESALDAAIDLPVNDLHRQHKVDRLLQGIKPQKAMDRSLVKEIRAALASKRDFSVIRTLLAAGADVNSNEGAPVFWAVRDPDIMDLILSKRPKAHSLSKTFQQAVKLNDPARYNLCGKLLRAGAVGEEVNKALSVAVKDGPAAIPLLRMLLPHADVNYKEGMALRLVVQQVFLEGLELLLAPGSVKPSMATKVGAFQVAMKLKKQERHTLIERLLGARIQDSVISEALIIAANESDLRLTELLLKSGACVEHKSGQAVLCAASVGRQDILKLLVKGPHGAKATLSTLTSGFSGAMTLKEKNLESFYPIVQTLLEAGVRGAAIDTALVEAVKEGDKGLRWSKMLYESGASVEWDNGAAINIAATSAFMATLALLLQKPPSEVVLKRAYRSTSNLPSEKRYEVIELLLKSGKSIDNHVSNTLTSATRENPPDRRLINLLLRHQVFDEGKSMFHAANIMDLETLGLLVEAPKAGLFMNSTFGAATSTEYVWQSHKGFSIIELLLKKGASGEPVAEALYRMVTVVSKSSNGSEDLAREFLDLLLQFGADVNYQRGLTLQRAAMHANLEVIQKVLPGATANTKAMALPYLFTTSDDMTVVLKGIQSITDSSTEGDKSFFFGFQHPDSQLEPVLFSAVGKFPGKPVILRAVLDAGYNPNQWISQERDASVGAEPWPIICWALDQPQKRISNMNIELLIDEGGKFLRSI
jgi:hypothetical protein